LPVLGRNPAYVIYGILKLIYHASEAVAQTNRLAEGRLLVNELFRYGSLITPELRRHG
jgi:hypothetical protein